MPSAPFGLHRTIERVYLTYEGGTPLVHLSRSGTSEKDPDLVAAMFSAIQGFMDDSFSKLHAGVVRSIEIGERCHVAFGKGHWVLLYILYRGRESNRLEDRVIRFVGEIESRFGPMLQAWRGDMKDVEPLKEYLKEAWDVPEESAAFLPTPPAESA